MSLRRQVQQGVFTLLNGIVYTSLLLLWGLWTHGVAEGATYVRCEAGSLTVAAEEQPLSTILTALGKACGIRLTYLGAVGTRKVTATIATLSIGEGIRRLFELTGVNNYTVVSQPTSGRTSTHIQRIIILGGTEASVQSSPAGDSDPTGELPESPGIIRVSRGEMVELLNRPLTLHVTSTSVDTRGVLLTRGLKVETVEQGSLLAKAAIQQGDVMLTVNGVPLYSDAAILQVLQHSKESQGGVLMFEIVRNGVLTRTNLMVDATQ